MGFRVGSFSVLRLRPRWWPARNRPRAFCRHKRHDRRPPQDARKSFDAFGRVVQQYPQSEYAPDAHQRMVYLRNRLAEYEIHVAGYYMRRGAYVAAINRADARFSTGCQVSPTRTYSAPDSRPITIRA